MRTPREPKQLTLDLSRRGESPEDIRAWARAVVASLVGQRQSVRRTRLDDAADAGFDTWEEYRGER
jgi:hypothetical protein